MKNILLPLVILITIIGCVAAIQPIGSSFNYEEYSHYAKSGTSTVVGQAFLKTRGGTVKFGAGENVYLIPNTTYTREAINKGYLKRGVLMAGVDPRLNNFIRTTVADGNGNFEFYNLPAGSYWLLCDIRWEVPAVYGRSASLEETGSTVYRDFNIKEGQKLKVILTH
jgi:hypothetical protein